MVVTNSIQYTKCIYFGYLALRFSCSAEYSVKADNAHSPNFMEPIKFEMNHSWICRIFFQMTSI